MRCQCAARPYLLILALVLSLAACAEMAPAPIPPARAPVAESPAEPPGRATGTLTIGGVTATLNHAYGAVRRDPASAAREYIVVLLTDRPLPAEDRLPAALTTLAQNDRVRAVRLAWRADSDDVLVALYHRDLVQSGLAFRGQSNLSVNALSATRIDAEVASKKLGQPWAFQAAFAADLARGGVATIEPLAARSAASTGGPGPPGPIGELARRRPRQHRLRNVAVGCLMATVSRSERGPSAGWPGVPGSQAAALLL